MRRFPAASQLHMSVAIALLAALVAGLGLAWLGPRFAPIMIGASAGLVGLALICLNEFSGLLLLAVLYPMLQLELRGLPLAKIYACGLLGLLVARFVWDQARGTGDRTIYLPLLLPFGLLIAASLASVVNSLDPAATISRVMLQVAVMYVVVLVTYNMITSWAQLRMALMVMVAMGTISALIGWLNFAQGRFQAESSFYRRVTPPEYLGGTHVALAELLVVLAPIALGLALTSRRPRARWLLFGLAGLFAVTTFFTLSRAGWICLAIQAPLWLWAFRRKPLVLAGSAAGVLLAAALAAGPMLNLLSSYVRESSDQVRDYLADLAVELFVRHPLLGVGFGTFARYNYMIYDRSYSPPLPLDAHGVVYKVMSETGLFGLLALALLLGTIFWRLGRGYLASRRHPHLRPIMIGALIALFVSTVFELSSTRFFSLQYWFPVGVLLAAARLAASEAGAPAAGAPGAVGVREP